MITQDQLKDVVERTESLYRYLEIDKKKIEFEEEDLRTQAPDFWDDPKRAEEQMKKVKTIKKWLDGYKEVKTLADELELAFDFYKDEMVTEEEVDEDYQKAIQAIEDLELMNLAPRKVSDDVVTKLIIECCYLSDDEKVLACRLAKKAGFDFVKTSTGFGPGGATVEDVALMRKTVGKGMGVKAAGGIRTLDDALGMLAAGANRLGCSAGVEIVSQYVA